MSSGSCPWPLKLYVTNELSIRLLRGFFETKHLMRLTSEPNPIHHLTQANYYELVMGGTRAVVLSKIQTATRAQIEISN